MAALCSQPTFSKTPCQNFLPLFYIGQEILVHSEKSPTLLSKKSFTKIGRNRSIENGCFWGFLD
jgi:hypothetical protein